MKKIILIFLFIPGIIIAQSKVDSLQNLLDSSIGNKKFEILLKLTEVLKKREPEQAMQYINEALKIAQNLHDKTGQSECFDFLGKIHHKKVNYDSAIFFYEKALDIRLKNNDQQKAAELYDGVAKCYFSLGDYKNSMDYNNKALLLNQKTGNRKLEARILSNLGRILLLIFASFFNISFSFSFFSVSYFV